MIAPMEQVAGNTKLEHITKLTTAFAKEHEALSAVVSDMDAEISMIRLRYMGRIRSAVAKARTAKTFLHTAIEAAPELFKKPRTLELHGIKIGFRKGSGGIDWDDDDKVCELIKKNFPKAQAELLIKTTDKPIAKALADLDVAELKKLGCRVEATGDVVVISPTNSEVDKLVTALLANEKDLQEA